MTGLRTVCAGRSASLSTLSEDIARVFAAVVTSCDRKGLVKRESFADDPDLVTANGDGDDEQAASDRGAEDE